MLKHPGVLMATAAVVLLATAGPARADGGLGVTVACSGSNLAPGCTVTAQTPGHPAAMPAAQVRQQGGVGGTGVCHDWDGRVAPCSDPGYGWMGSTGCYYQLDPTWRPPVWDTADQPPPGQPGAFYDVTCAGIPGTGVAITWLPAGTVGALPPPAPAVLARQATSQLTLSVGTIGASPSPGAEQLVNLPTWVWLASWRQISASAAVPGESVTATARPTSAAWTFGDGAELVCQGPGTRYTAGYGPSAPSPTCGHTYTTSSAAEPGGAYPVRVTVTWSITWAGGGQGGTEPVLRSTAGTQFRVAESQAINTIPSPSS